MTSENRRLDVRAPLVRTAGYALLAACGSWAVLFVALAVVVVVRPLPTGTRQVWFLIIAVLFVPLIGVTACAVGVLRGSRPLATTAIVLVCLLTPCFVLALPPNAVLVVLLVMARRTPAPPDGGAVPHSAGQTGEVSSSERVSSTSLR